MSRFALPNQLVGLLVSSKEGSFDLAYLENGKTIENTTNTCLTTSIVSMKSGGLHIDLMPALVDELKFKVKS